MSKIGDDHPKRITPQEQELYRQEYRHGAELFEKALEQHAKSSNMFQQEEFKDVMENAMQVLNDTARALKLDALKNQNKEIEKDYEAYQKSPTPDTEKKLINDLEKAKRSV